MTLASTVACRPVLVPALGWIALHAAALWPHGLWAARRLADGSDDPLGLAALAVLVVWLALAHPALRPVPRLGWLVAAAALTAAATATLFAAPPLPAALLAALALWAHLAAWLPDRAPRAALAGLAMLALPLVASLQFYVGYPLRAFTAQFSAWLLQALGFAAERSGAAMTVGGQLIIVDAPCSGVQLAWMGYFAACAVAAFARVPDAVLLRRVPLVGTIVLAGNVLRNTTLVALEARPQALAPWAHEAIGLAALAVVSVLVIRVVAPHAQARPFTFGAAA
ncbi:MAG: exosortase Q [Aquincola sp.]|nr:exosortase Q [Aquincola sp.]